MPSRHWMRTLGNHSKPTYIFGWVDHVHVFAVQAGAKWRGVLDTIVFGRLVNWNELLARTGEGQGSSRRVDGQAVQKKLVWLLQRRHKHLATQHAPPTHPPTHPCLGGNIEAESDRMVARPLETLVANTSIDGESSKDIAREPTKIQRLGWAQERCTRNYTVVGHRSRCVCRSILLLAGLEEFPNRNMFTRSFDQVPLLVFLVLRVFIVEE